MHTIEQRHMSLVDFSDDIAEVAVFWEFLRKTDVKITSGQMERNSRRGSTAAQVRTHRCGAMAFWEKVGFWRCACWH